MAYKSLQNITRRLEKNGVLKRIKTEVDSELEIMEIAHDIEMSDDVKKFASRRWQDYGIE